MRIKVIKTKYSANYYVIKTVYVDGVEKTKTIEKLGSIEDLKAKLGDIDVDKWARNYAKELTRLEKENQEPTVMEKYSPQTLLEKDEQLLYNGGYLFLQSIYKSLKVDKLCKNIQKKYKFAYNLDSILSRLIYSRILFPASKLATSELSKKFIEQPDFDLHHIYRALDVLSKESENIQATLYKNSLNLIDRNSKILYYDCTNFFFELEQEDGIKQYGVSKENRPNPIVQMGLFMDGDGIPLAYSITPGNQNEQTTLKPLEKQILKDFDLSQIVVCTDAGLASNANRKFNNVSGRAFITTQSIKKLKGFLKDWALDPTGWKRQNDHKEYDLRELYDTFEKDVILFKERWIKENDLQQRLIVTYSSKYKEYQQSIRERQITRAVKTIEKNPKKIITPKATDSKRFISQIKTTDDGEIAENSILYLNENQVKKEEMYDGFYAVCTNLEDSAVDIFAVNHRRWKIEECFRILKSEFRARPVFLKNEDRINAHFLTCFMALLVFRILESKLSSEYTCRDIVTQLSDMNFFKLKYGGYRPVYTRTIFTDCLHDKFRFRSDYEVLTQKQLNKIKKITI